MLGLGFRRFTSYSTIGALLLSALPAYAGNDAPAPAQGAAATPAAATPPSEATIKEARDHYEAGLALYSDGEFQRAAIEFDRAYELVPNYRALYNIGQVRIQLHNYARAMTALKAYLKEGGSKIEAERKKSVQDDLEMLSTRTALLTVETNEEGAEIVVDGEIAGTSPLPEPLLLDTGDHRIGARKPGFVPRENSITLASRDTLSMRIDLQKEEVNKPVVFVAPTTPPADRTAWIWGTWSATAVLAVGAGVTGGLGIKAANELDDKRSTFGATRDELDSAQSRARTLLNTSTVLGVGAIAMGGVALYLTLSKPAGPEKSKKRAGLRVGPTSVDLVGQF
ncbi:MAG TPA: PEGA domain-containing protein [Polyangiaceae bacterium]|jgi:tetratricopeptide (TPR) repeat protein|nr:PEGA domain-containing protein [Polyangiaceae bacterium]